MKPTAAHHRPSPLAILIIPVVVALVLTLFAWPSARLEPRDLPIGVAGAPAGNREDRATARLPGGSLRRAPLPRRGRSADGNRGP